MKKMKKYIFFILTIFVLSCNQNQPKIVDGIDKDDKIYETTSDDVEMNIASKKAVDSIAIFEDRKSTRLNSSHRNTSRMPSSA